MIFTYSVRFLDSTIKFSLLQTFLLSAIFGGRGVMSLLLLTPADPLIASSGSRLGKGCSWLPSVYTTIQTFGTCMRSASADSLPFLTLTNILNLRGASRGIHCLIIVVTERGNQPDRLEERFLEDTSVPVCVL